MPTNPITNDMTRQGTHRDVASYFQISDLIGPDFTPEQLRGIVSSNWMCQKVVGYIPKEMVNIQFGLSLGGQPGKTKTIQDLTMIQDQLRRLMPWFGECQKRANIVGKSYLIIQANGFKFEEDIDLPEDIMAEDSDAGDPEVDNDIQFENNSVADRNVDQFVTNAISQGVNKRKRRTIPFTLAGGNFQRSPMDPGDVGLETLVERFPNTFPIDWSNFVNMQVAGLEIVDGDQYRWSKSKKFLYRKDPSTKSQKEEEINVQRTISKWYDADPEGDTNIMEIIHTSHVIEFTAFDYQENPKSPRTNNIEPDGTAVFTNAGGIKTKKGEKVSFRLTRFISALMYFDSFVNSVLNRVHRSEFIAYKKENLGDTNLELARLSATQDYSHPAIAAPVIDAQAAIMQELETVAASALNHGVVMVDKESEINMVARSFTGIQNIHDVFRPLVIGASGLTEFTLMGLTMASAGLNSHDVRDRMAISGQVDILFRDTWQPMLEKLANTIATSYTNFPIYSYVSVKAGASFKLTELEIADVLDTMIQTRLDLVREGIISREQLLAELKGDGLIGKYFVITEPDKATQREIANNLELLSKSLLSTGQSTPTKSTNAAPITGDGTTSGQRANVNIKAKVKSNE